MEGTLWAFLPALIAIVLALVTKQVYVSLFLGIFVGIIVALIYRKTLFKGEAVPFVMELPNYRLPSARSVLLLMWEKALDFLQRAFGIIFVATVLIWFFQNFDNILFFLFFFLFLWFLPIWKTRAF